MSGLNKQLLWKTVFFSKIHESTLELDNIHITSWTIESVKRSKSDSVNLWRSYLVINCVHVRVYCNLRQIYKQFDE